MKGFKLTQKYKHLTTEIYEAICPQNGLLPDLRLAQELLRNNISKTGEIKTKSPLERMLTIIEKNSGSGLEKDIEYHWVKV